MGYSGTFFWVNNKKLFSNSKWNDVDGLYNDPHRHGVEMYFGHVFNEISGFEILTSNQRHLYQQENWDYINKNEKKLINPCNLIYIYIQSSGDNSGNNPERPNPPQ